jgi:hypothetical protein
VPRDRGAAAAEIPGKLTDRMPTAAQETQNLATRRIGDRPEHRIGLLPSGRRRLRHYPALRISVTTRLQIM